MSDDPFALPKLPPPSYTIVLDPPVKHNGADYVQLVLRAPKAGEVRRADEQLRGSSALPQLDLRNIHLVSMVSGAPVPVIEQIGVHELNLAMAYLNLFLAYGPATGGS